ncbi:peptide-methionine (S)-S-oxide reductase MsrA [Fibrivirga algicola]|uniref:Peptide methionine sulfoxide reductase MsrA n=1 Tax=Fibrivirga algicola TaxID=2950420 RepID=A0ABX0QHR9_9BACT|nr:peptide-methionine (S)-S-oxide reductase MsrA [Fibrivirga algicola]NID11996.1 peptide-methionine (S)-S-oxide reductase MsrA [Fibrivirga algicola]
MRHFLLLLLIPLYFGCATKKGTDSDNQPTVKDTSPAKLPTLQPGEAVATFAGGCFWCVEEEFELLRGVREAVSGYSGGIEENPTYEQVGNNETGHAESVQVYYDPKVIPYDTLVKAFLYAHDPTTLNRQGPDAGKQYRSVAFYRSPAEKASIDAAIKRFNATAEHTDQVVTQVVPFNVFYPAEVYHQGYYRAHPDEAYIRSVSEPKVEKFKKRLTDKLKAAQ